MDFELLGICLDRKKIARGAHNAPDSIRRIFPQLETFVNGIDLEENGLEECKKIGASDYIIKPFDKEKVISTVEKYLG